MTVDISVNKWHSKHAISLHEETGCAYIVRLHEKADSVAPRDPQLFLGNFFSRPIFMHANQEPRQRQTNADACKMIVFRSLRNY